MPNHPDTKVFLDLLIDTTQSIVAELGPDGTIREVKAPKGREPGFDVLGKKPHELFKTEASESIMGLLHEVARSGREQKKSIQINYQDRTFWYALTVFPFFFADGEIEKFIVISADIEAEKSTEESLRKSKAELEDVIAKSTAEVSFSYSQLLKESEERHIAEKALSESRRQYQILVETVTDWIWEIDCEAKFTYSSPRSFELLGYKPSELIGRLRYDFIDPEYRDQAFSTFRNFADASIPFNSIQSRFLHKNGKVVIVESNGAPVFNSDGIVEGYRGVSRDITERNYFERSLRKSEKKLSDHLQQTPLGYIEWDITKEVLDWNPAATRIFGFSRIEAMRGRTFSKIVPSDFQQYLEKVWQDILKGKSVHSINQNIRKDGKRIYCEWFNTLIRNEQNQPIAISSLVSDVSDRRQLEMELKFLAELLEESNDIISISSATKQKVVFMNKAGRNTFGWPDNDDLTGRSVAECHPAWIIELLEKEWLPKIIEDGIWKGDSAVIAGDGKEIPARQIIMSHKNSEGEIEFYSTMVRLGE